VRTKILIAVGAWLLGAVTATCGSLLAVSLLGNSFGVSASQGQQLTVAAVQSALAAPEKLHVSAGGPAPSALASVPHAKAVRAGDSQTRRRQATTPPAPQQAEQPGTLLDSPAGTVVASCARGAAYLVSWSPAQGYGSDQIFRGPAAVAKVTFDAGGSAMTMAISCHGGTPTAATFWGHDDGGSGGGGSGGGSGSGSGGD
jgi:uncharacterized membrane protein YgcG